MMHGGFPIFAGELEIRARGDRRTLAGVFPYSPGPGRLMATVASRGRTRKERIAGDAFGWQLREFARLQDNLAGAIEESQVERLRQELERRNVHVLSGHSYDKPLGDLRSGTAAVTSTREAVRFEVDLPPEAAQPSYMRDTVAMVNAGLAGGISPGFRVPPASAVRDAEVLEPEPGNPGVQVRVINQAVLFELSVVTRPAYSETDVDVRSLAALGNERRRRVQAWL